MSNIIICFVAGFAGTPGYLSPEVLRKDPYGKPVDIWACGEYTGHRRSYKAEIIHLIRKYFIY